MRRRSLLIGLLIVLSFALTSFTYAFWASGVTGPDNQVADGTIQIGDGEQVTTSVTLTGDNFTGGKLVPSGLANAGEGEVDEIELTFTVVWNATATPGASLTGTTTTGDLTINITKVVLNSEDPAVDVTALVGSLVVITPNIANASSITLGASAITITFTVTLTEPTTIAQYQALAGGSITIDFEFVVSNVQTVNS